MRDAGREEGGHGVSAGAGTRRAEGRDLGMEGMPDDGPISANFLSSKITKSISPSAPSRTNSSANAVEKSRTISQCVYREPQTRQGAFRREQSLASDIRYLGHPP